jgi:hypothetical protein
MPRHHAAVWLAGLWLMSAAPALAQPGRSFEPAQRRFAFGGDLSALLAPADNHSYFNYTDYERDALRLARLRLYGEARAHPTLSFVGEIRTENLASVDVAALYLRWRPLVAHPVTIQAGRIPPVIGSFNRRAYGRDNVVFGQPLAYQYLTALRADALPATRLELLEMRARGWSPVYGIGSQQPGPGLPLASASEWDTGIEASWESERVTLAGAVTRGSPAQPVVRDTNSGLMWSGRMAARVASAVVGVSGARGEWLSESARRAAGLPDTPAAQALIGVDAEFGSGPWLLRGEWLHSRFTLPLAAEAGTALSLSSTGAFLEGRYRLHPRWQLGLRAERLDFSRIAHPLTDGPTTWDAPVSRAEAALGLRVTRQLEVRLGWQHNWRDGGRIRERGMPVGGVLYWF